MMICSAVLIIQNIIKISKKQPVQVSTFNLLTEVKALMILTILFITYFICRITDLFVLGAIFCSIAFLVYFWTAPQPVAAVRLLLFVYSVRS